MEVCSISQRVLHHGEAGEAGRAEPRAPLLWVWDSPGGTSDFSTAPSGRATDLANTRLLASWQAPTSIPLPAARPSPAGLPVSWWLRGTCRAVWCSAPLHSPSPRSPAVSPRCAPADRDQH